MRVPSYRRRLRELVTGALALWLAACTPAEPELRIVVVTFDTLRADGLDARRMPRTHAFSERGLRFERFYAASSATQPTPVDPNIRTVARPTIPLVATTSSNSAT